MKIRVEFWFRHRVGLWLDTSVSEDLTVSIFPKMEVSQPRRQWLKS